MSNKKIFVIDDDPMYLERIKMLLSMDYDISTFSNTDAVTDQINEHLIPDLIITDLKMQTENGDVFTKFLKLNDETADIPIIIMSSYLAGRGMGDALSSDCDDIIAKPVSKAELEAKINALLKKIRYPLSIIHYPLSIIHYPLSIIHYPLSIIHYPLSIIYFKS